MPTPNPEEPTRIANHFKDSNLKLPAIPTKLARRMAERHDAIWSSRTRPPNVYTPFHRPLEEAVTTAARDYATIGHTGHGINSYIYSFHMVYGQLAIFVGSSYGGAYGDPEKQTAKLNRQWRRSSDIIAAYERVRRQIPEDRRLVVLEDGLSGERGAEWVDIVSADSLDHENRSLLGSIPQGGQFELGYRAIGELMRKLYSTASDEDLLELLLLQHGRIIDEITDEDQTGTIAQQINFAATSLVWVAGLNLGVDPDWQWLRDRVAERVCANGIEE